MSTMFRAARPHEMRRPVPAPPPAPVSFRRGRCTQVALCELATLQRVVELPDDEPFVCPRCLGELAPVLPGAGRRSRAVMAAQATVILLAACGAGYRVWSELAAPPMSVQAAPAPVPGPQHDPAPDTPPAAAPSPQPDRQRDPVVLRVASTAPRPDPATGLTFPGPDTGLAARVTPTDVLFLAAGPPAPAPAPAPTASDPLADYVNGATRLPITIHFAAASTRLDWRGHHDLDRLANYLHAHHTAPDRVMLAGFSDTLGDADDNDSMARHRTAAVASALARMGLAPGHVASFGKDDPAGDNASSDGRSQNRRVEIYLRAE